jgi:hypothetical protein
MGSKGLLPRPIRSKRIVNKYTPITHSSGVGFASTANINKYLFFGRVFKIFNDVP